MSANTSSSSPKSKKSLKQDLFEHPDFYAIDDLLNEEQKLIRSSIRDFVKREISPYIDDWAQRAHFPLEIVKKFGDIGAFGPTIPTEYGGGGLDYISYGILMQVVAVVMIRHLRYYNTDIPKRNQVEAHAVNRQHKRPKGTSPEKTKQMMVKYINTRLGLSQKYKENDKTKQVSDDDIADAIAVGLAWFTRLEKDA